MPEAQLENAVRSAVTSGSDTTPIAALPMYDWPEVRHATDALWQSLRDALRSGGIDAPASLRRDLPPAALWSSKRLLLTQTCGLPYVSSLRGKVALLGTPDYAVPGCSPGWYRSAIVVRRAEKRSDLLALRGVRWAVNDRHSQSGYQALLQTWVRRYGTIEPGFEIIESGSHRQSIDWVASSQADVAAIDYVSWRLAVSWLPAVQELRVLQLTEPRPGLPYIAGCHIDTDAAVGAVSMAIGQLDPEIRAILGLAGFWCSTPRDYDIIDRCRV